MNEQTRKAANDLLAQISLYTDCMSNQIDRENLDPYMDKLERALDESTGPMKFHVQELRPEVLAFALLMEERLREKDEIKGQSWKNMEIDTLRVCSVVKCYQAEQHIHKGDNVAAAHSAVDLANYAMMIADVAGALVPEAGRTA